MRLPLRNMAESLGLREGGERRCTEGIGIKLYYIEVVLLLKEVSTKVTDLINFKSKKIVPKILKIQAVINFALEYISTEDCITLLKCKIQIQMDTSNFIPLSTNMQNMKGYGESLFHPRGLCTVTLRARDLML